MLWAPLWDGVLIARMRLFFECVGEVGGVKGVNGPGVVVELGRAEIGRAR